MITRALPLVVFATLTVCAAATAAPAAFTGLDPDAPPTTLPPAMRAAGLDEQLGATLPGDLVFVDSRGEPAALSSTYEGGKPALLVLAYYRCPMLCGLVLRGLVKGLGDLDFRLGEEYRAVTVSIDPRDTPRAAFEKQEKTLDTLAQGDKTADWRFLVGEERQVRTLADSIGFRYAYDERTDQYAHPAVVVVLTPTGRISRYLYGTDFSARDLRLALVEAGEGKTGTLVDRVLLTCYRFDPATRRYGAYILGFMRLGGAAIFLFVSGLLGALWAHEWRRKRAKAPSETGGSP